MNNQKVLTVTIPTWNRSKLLDELLNELIAQIISDNLQDQIEVLICNNGSDDDTEAISLSLKSKFDFISYHNNGINKGARYNVLKCMEISNAKYLILLGDDDRINPGSLFRVIQFLKSKPLTGLLFDSHLFKTNPFGNAKLTLSQLLNNFYYYLGNAGLFIVQTEFAARIIKSRAYDSFSPTWPQTQVMILAAEQFINEEIHIYDFEIMAKGKHDAVMIYTSYYLWRTTYLDLLTAIEMIKSEVKTDNYLAAKSYFQKRATQNFFNILQCGVFLDERKLKLKTAKEIFNNLYKFSLKEKFLLFISVCALIMPAAISRPLSNFFIFTTRGKSGLNKKNAFVKNELQKRFLKNESTSKSIREFDFVKA